MDVEDIGAADLGCFKANRDKSDATRLGVVRPWLFALTFVSGLIASNAVIAHDGKKHTDEIPQVLHEIETLLIMESGEVIAIDTHLHEEGPVW